jgi:hypothetical protein
MRNKRPAFAATILFAVVLVMATAASAQPRRTFVSALRGDDANVNICSVAQPCRSFQIAFNSVATGGEVVALDSGGYGALQINKSVTITGSGVAVITAPSGGNGVGIVAADAVVILRGLTISGVAGGAIGIQALSGGANAATIQIESCVVTGFTANGIDINHIVQGSSTRVLSLKDTVVRNCGINGAVVEANPGLTFKATVDHCRFEANGAVGLYVSQSFAVVSESVASHNGQSGFLTINLMTFATFYHCVAASNAADGFFASGGGTARVGYSTATLNGAFGFHNLNSTFESQGNNFVRGNLAMTETSGTITNVGSV